MFSRKVLVRLLWFVNCCACSVLPEVQCPGKIGEDEVSGIKGEELSSEDSGLVLVYPGTKWCGLGNVSESYDDLGPSKKADMCCREHDNCPDFILSGDTKYNLTNTQFLTMMSCDCDEKLRECLHNANTITATNVGVLFFDVLGTECFKYDYQVTGCANKTGLLIRKCLEYTYDKNGEKRYQFFDVPFY